jgi:hypothetical protein
VQLASQTVPIDMDVLTAGQIDAIAEKALSSQTALAEWGDPFRRAVQAWRRSMLERVNSGHRPSTEDVELFGIRIGPAVFIGVNAEVFSSFTDRVRGQTGRAPLYTVGYANGNLGYMPDSIAYEEGGYEVEFAHFFYNRPRICRGSLEKAAGHALHLVEQLTHEGQAR